LVETNEFGETTKIRKGEGGIMKLQSKIATSVGLMLFLACVSFAQHVKTDYDHSANFGQYKTYSWEKVQTKDQLLVDRIKSAVNSALAAKGWTEVPSEAVAVGEDSSVDLATRPQRLKPTRWGP
jgi:hypothetical protein